MNRLIIVRLGAISLLAALLALGCAVEQTTDGGEDQSDPSVDGSHMVGIGVSGEEQVSAGERPTPSHRTGPRVPEASGCVGCGPLPDPWKKMGPLPDPWSSSSGGEGNTSGSGEGSTSGGAKNSK